MSKMASSSRQNRRGENLAAKSSKTAANPIRYAQIDGLVVLKIIKHCQDAGDDTELLQGVLLGLVVDDRLEITNCFPFPRHAEDEDFDEMAYQLEMMRNLRQVNVDHLHVGWYQSTFYGAFLNRALLESQFQYQNQIEESVVLIYDPQKTSQGFLALTAYRLTKAAMDLCNEGIFTAEKLRGASLSYAGLFEELPLVIRNSHLVNALCCQLEGEDNVGATKGTAPGSTTLNPGKYQFLDLATSSSLEHRLRMLMECVDDCYQETNKFHNYQRQVARQSQARQQYLQRRSAENTARKNRDETPLPEEDINKVFKPLPPYPRQDSLLMASQIANYCTEVNKFASQSLGKMFITGALQADKKS